jgi:hypothetical protein
MEALQLKQVKTLARQMGLPDGRGRHAAICMAQLVKMADSRVRQDALDTLLDVLIQGPSPEARKWAAWALGGLAGSIDPHDLSNRVVPTLISILHPVDLTRVDLRVAGQAYHSLLFIGTPDAVVAAERYKSKMIEARQQQLS